MPHLIASNFVPNLRPPIELNSSSYCSYVLGNYLATRSLRTWLERPFHRRLAHSRLKIDNSKATMSSNSLLDHCKLDYNCLVAFGNYCYWNLLECLRVCSNSMSCRMCWDMDWRRCIDCTCVDWRNVRSREGVVRWVEVVELTSWRCCY